ncbi:MAG: hypothetical protein ABDH16_00115 [Thermodesulfovibrionaceae bacterium]
MLSYEEKIIVSKYAYIPEHLIDYVVAVSGAEPFFHEDCIYFVKNSHLIFIGYPLKEAFSFEGVKKILFNVIDKLKPKTVAFIAPEILISEKECLKKNSDFYYILELSTFALTSKLRNSIKRASKEVEILYSKDITKQHITLIEEVIQTHRFDEYTEHIYRKIPEYVNSSSKTFVFSAINSKGQLVGFDVADYESENFCFYMFNLISKSTYIPGVSDLLFYEIVKEAKKQKKQFVNMGLGINEGVTFFKKKWGSRKFLDYNFCLFERGIKFLNALRRIF